MPELRLGGTIKRLVRRIFYGKEKRNCPKQKKTEIHLAESAALFPLRPQARLHERL